MKYRLHVTNCIGNGFLLVGEEGEQSKAECEAGHFTIDKVLEWIDYIIGTVDADSTFIITPIT